MPLDRARRLAVAGLLLAAFLGLYALSNLTATGQRSENRLLRAHDAFGMLPALIDRSALPPFDLDVATVVMGTLLAVGIAAARRRWRDALTVAVATPAAVVATSLFKHVAGRPRLVPGRDFDVSFPSGHAAIALAVTAGLLLVVPRRWLRWAAPLLLGWSALVAAVLQAVGDHRPSEVLGSGLLVAAVFLTVGALTTGRTLRPLRRTAGRALVPVLVLAVAGSWNTLPWAAVLYAAVAVAATALVGWAALSGRSVEPHQDVAGAGREPVLRVPQPG